jgi:FtsK/SpoIIIE family
MSETQEAQDENNTDNTLSAITIAGASVPIVESIIALAHGGVVGGIVGLGVSGLVWLVADEAAKKGRGITLPASLPKQRVARPGQPSIFSRMLTGKDDRGEYDAIQAEASRDPLFQKGVGADDTGGVERLTVDQIVANSNLNDFRIWIGRSLTLDGNPAWQISIYKQHIKFIGGSQKGKSSMVAAFLEIITRTHDTRHIQLILLDMESLTSWLFADLPHVVKMRSKSGETVKMHATNKEQVLEYLIQSVGIMNNRYEIIQRDGIAALKKMPVILVYIEEFLRLKAWFKAQIKIAKDKQQAESDYATLIYCINELAGRGLKSRMQLLLCAQMDYTDEDFREAMGNIGSGFSFCVKQEAAMAAGFTNAKLLARNERSKKVGQAVVEAPDCNDLILAPQYDLEARLEAWQDENAAVSPQETEHLEPVYQQQDQHQERQIEQAPAPAVPASPSTENQRKLTSLHRQALEHYKPGLGYRQLGDLIGVGKDKAGELIKELKRWGFIENEAGD